MGERSLRSRRRRHGVFVVVAGTDGAGKTTVVEHLAATALAGRPVLHLHHRPRVLGGLTTHDGPVTEPHRQDPYPRWLSTGKLVYLWLDHLVGWLVSLRPHLRRGGDVLLERGWWDLAVDPRRYRLQPHPRLVRVLGGLLPRPSATIVLLADPAVLATRTTELDAAELARQVAAWRQYLPRSARAREIDAGQDPDSVLEQARSIVADGRHPAGWTGLPTARRPRWIVPRGPRKAVANGLRVYSPVTPRAILGWALMRLVAALGMAPILPRTEPPHAALDRTADVVPPGGTVAVGQGSHRGRSVVLVLDAAGRPTVLAKISMHDHGAAALVAEADASERFQDRLPATLRAPALLDRRQGRVCFEAIRWRLRLRPWRLPIDVARDLGRFYATSADAESGPSHGDCAPWNLLRGPDAWYLVDWADATEAAPAFTDPLHYLVQSHALLGRPSRRALLAGLDGRGGIGQALQAYAAAAGLAFTDARPALVGYLDATLPQMDPTTDDGRRGLSARRALRRALQVPGTP